MLLSLSEGGGRREKAPSTRRRVMGRLSGYDISGEARWAVGSSGVCSRLWHKSSPRVTPYSNSYRLEDRLQHAVRHRSGELEPLCDLERGRNRPPRSGGSNLALSSNSSLRRRIRRFFRIVVLAAQHKVAEKSVKTRGRSRGGSRKCRRPGPCPPWSRLASFGNM